jgi:hypothetical protein
MPGRASKVIMGIRSGAAASLALAEQLPVEALNRRTSTSVETLW